MTPFMLRVAEVIGVDHADEELPTPATRPSVLRPVNKGNDMQIAYRGLTEQLVCEVNAMLSDEDDHMSLVDDIIDPARTREQVARALEMLIAKRDIRPAKKHGLGPT